MSNPSNLAESSSSFSYSKPSHSFEYEGGDLEAMAAAKNYSKWIAEEFRPYLKGKIAEVGAGSGNFSNFLLNPRVESIHAFEPSARMHRILHHRYRHEKRVTTANAYLAEVESTFVNSFDAVIYNNVMEHVEDDASELESVFRVLKPGGCVLIYVPALQWLYSDFDRSLGHFRRYDKSTGSELLLKAGFTVEGIKYADVLGVLPWFILMKLMKRGLSKGNVGLYDRVGVPITRRLESLVPAPFGKNILLIGRKAVSN